MATKQTTVRREPRAALLWLSYEVGAETAVKEITRLLKAIVPERTTICYHSTRREGGLEVQVLLCFEKRMRLAALSRRCRGVWAVGGVEKLVDIRYPNVSNGHFAFLETWATIMCRGGRVACGDDFATVRGNVESMQHAHGEVVRQMRRRQRERQKERGGNCDPLPRAGVGTEDTVLLTPPTPPTPPTLFTPGPVHGSGEIRGEDDQGFMVEEEGMLLRIYPSWSLLML